MNNFFKMYFKISNLPGLYVMIIHWFEFSKQLGLNNLAAGGGGYHAIAPGCSSFADLSALYYNSICHPPTMYHHSNRNSITTTAAANLAALSSSAYFNNSELSGGGTSYMSAQPTLTPNSPVAMGHFAYEDYEEIYPAVHNCNCMYD